MIEKDFWLMSASSARLEDESSAGELGTGVLEVRRADVTMRRRVKPRSLVNPIIACRLKWSIL